MEMHYILAKYNFYPGRALELSNSKWPSVVVFPHNGNYMSALTLLLLSITLNVY